MKGGKNLGDKVIGDSNNILSSFFLNWCGKYALVNFLQTSLASKIKLERKIFLLLIKVMKLTSSIKNGNIIGCNTLKIGKKVIYHHHKN